MSKSTMILICFALVCLIAINILYFLPSQIGSSLPLYLRVIYETLHGNFADGILVGKMNNLDFSKLQIGDIILVGNPKAVYGKYTHVALYVGNNLVVDGNIGEGIRYTSLERYRIYAYAKILRVKTSNKIKIMAAKTAQENIGKVFFLIAPKSNPNLTYCGKIVWEAYKRAGIELLPEKYKKAEIILPDYFLQSLYVFEVE